MRKNLIKDRLGTMDTMVNRAQWVVMALKGNKAMTEHVVLMVYGLVFNLNRCNSKVSNHNNYYSIHQPVHKGVFVRYTSLFVLADACFHCRQSNQPI